MKYLLTFLLITSAFLFSGCTKEQGCTNPEACNFSQSAEEDDGSCYLPGEECDDGIDTTILDQYTNTCQCEGIDPSLGCTNDTACNYSNSANIDDESCYFIGDSCDDGNSDTLNDSWSNSCSCSGELPGCTSTNACNYNSDADIDDESCYFIGDSCDDGYSTTLNDTWSSSCSCTGDLLGCTSTNACNYNSAADIDDDSCYFIGDSCDDGYSATTNDTWSNSCICTGELPGCTSIIACNYNAEAELDDGSCYFEGDTCDDGNSSTTNDTWSNSCVCEGYLSGTCGSDVYHEGYNYSTVLISDQCWFSENCRYLPAVSNSSYELTSETTPHYYVYDYQGTSVAAAKATDNYETYGVLYNWPTVISEDLCPSGWHIPSNEDFNQLTDFLGGNDTWPYGVAAIAMKDDVLWNGSNSSGFSALPGGYQWSAGASVSMGYSALFWTSQSCGGTNAWNRTMDSDSDGVGFSCYNASYGLYVRCVMD